MTAAPTPEEQGEVDRVDAGNPSAPDPKLRYTLTDCFVCGAISVCRSVNPTPEGCPTCGRAVAAITVGRVDVPDTASDETQQRSEGDRT